MVKLKELRSKKESKNNKREGTNVEMIGVFRQVFTSDSEDVRKEFASNLLQALTREHATAGVFLLPGELVIVLLVENVGSVIEAQEFASELTNEIFEAVGLEDWEFTQIREPGIPPELHNIVEQFLLNIHKHRNDSF